VNCLLRKGQYAERLGTGTPVYLARILSAEIFKLAGNATRD
jgi:histone H2A